MNERIDSSQKVKGWNWGAFLLCLIWSIRHRIWQGLLSLVPIFGLFVPFWLGATGNQKAWIKSRHKSVESFFKEPKALGLCRIDCLGGYYRFYFRKPFLFY